MPRNYYIWRPDRLIAARVFLSVALSLARKDLFSYVYSVISFRATEGAVPAVNFHDNFRAGAIPLVCIAAEGASDEYTGSGTRYVPRRRRRTLSECVPRVCVYFARLQSHLSHNTGSSVPRYPEFPFKYRADVLRVRSQAAGVNSRRRFRARDLCHYLRERAR